MTVRTREYLGDGYFVHMYRLKESRIPNEKNLLFVCGRADAHTSETFNRLGCSLLSECLDSSLIVMDELGPHEAKADMFRQKVLRLLDGPIPIVGILQDPAEVFWPEIVNHPDVRILTISIKNLSRNLLTLVRRGMLFFFFIFCTNYLVYWFLMYCLTTSLLMFPKVLM